MTPPIQVFGKFILTGEHFILYQTPALVMPWPAASLELFPETLATPEAPSERVMETWQLARSLCGLSATSSFPFRIESSIPIGCGFGSSAALCVALLRAAMLEANVELPQLTSIQYATQMEALFHGRSSGLDPTIATIQRPLRFDMTPSWSPFAWRLEGFGLVLAISREARQTAVAVGRVRQFSEHSSARFGEMVKEVQQIVHTIETLLSAPSMGTPVDAEIAQSPASMASDTASDTAGPSQTEAQKAAQIGASLTKNHRILAEVGVSSEHLDALVDAALAAGALGAKLTGAGMGGGMLAFAPLAHLPTLSAALQKAGATHCATCIPQSQWTAS